MMHDDRPRKSVFDQIALGLAVLALAYGFISAARADDTPSFGTAWLCNSITATKRFISSPPPLDQQVFAANCISARAPQPVYNAQYTGQTVVVSGGPYDGFTVYVWSVTLTGNGDGPRMFVTLQPDLHEDLLKRVKKSSGIPV